MTPDARLGSHFFCILLLTISGGCSRRTEAQPASQPSRDPAPAPSHPESCLGVSDKGVFGDLDEKVQLALPAASADQVTARIDRKHDLLVVSIDGFPRKVYPLGGAATLTVGKYELALRPGDRDELRPILAESRTREGAPDHDRDKDGIPDPLDILIGAKKTVLNADAYTAEAQGYIKLAYPGGDVKRTMGVCTDVIIRSVRNAGLDLQKELHEDILKRRKAYPMIKKAPDANIDQRRLGTLLPYFKAHWEQHTAKLVDP
jgi:hypothetical protein